LSRSSSHGTFAKILERQHVFGIEVLLLYYQESHHQIVVKQWIFFDNPLCTFSNSSWNDDIDTDRSLGCFMIFYMGGVVEHSIYMPDPVALSSAEAEYNEACLACMATAHLKQFLEG
jgi:hypothetical protein